MATWPSRRSGMIAEAAFDRIDALGLDLDVTPSIEADQYGWAEVFGPNPSSFRFQARLVSGVWARGFEPPGPTLRIVVPEWIAGALDDAGTFPRKSANAADVSARHTRRRS
jgi:hypothetical protein